MGESKLRITFVVLLLVLISATFVAMISRFLLTLLLAAILAGLSHPLHRRLVRLFHGRRALASVGTLLVLVVIVLVPLIAFLGALASQAYQISQSVGPWVQERMSEPDKISRFLERIPGLERLIPYRAEVLEKVGGIVGALGNFLVLNLSAATKLTIAFFFHLFLMLYAMFYFLTDGEKILRKILDYIPLTGDEESRMVGKFVSVTRATIKGTVVIGIVQGTLAGAALAWAGINGAVFWGTLMMVLSVIPGVGPALVWVPAVGYLFAVGRLASAILLAIFCALVVGTADNFLRPRLVGKDTRMHDLLILLSTLGGIALFGAIGFILGPIVAALFVTIWEIYGAVFRGLLPGGPSRPRQSL